MSKSLEFLSNLRSRRGEIILLYLDLFVITSFISVIWTSRSLITNSSLVFTENIFVSSISLVFFLLGVFLRYILFKHNQTLSFQIFATLAIALAIQTMFYAGVSSYIASMIIITIIFTSGIVVSVRFARTYLLVVIIATLLASALYSFEIIQHAAESAPSSNVGVTAVTLVFIYISYKTIEIAYRQIEDSYKKAEKYAEELTLLNAQLEEKVKLRAQQLEASFQKQLESMHSSALIGTIARSMLHDLVTPISSLDGAFNLLELDTANSQNAEVKESLTGGKEAVKQLRRIIENSRSLISGRPTMINFNVKSIIELALESTKSLFNKYEIKLNSDLPKDINYYGDFGLLERMILNLIVNSLEELSQSQKQERLIKIRAYTRKQELCIEVYDNGGGIPLQTQAQIFDIDYSTKNTRTNLGFGLPFVKQTLEKQFAGRIELESSVGKFTRFRLILPL